MPDVSTPIDSRERTPATAGPAFANGGATRPASVALRDARVARFAEPVAESVALLRLAIPAARELAALGEALVRSPAGESAVLAFALLDAAAAVAFDGHAVDPRAVLGDPDGRDAALARRHLDARRRALARAGSGELDRTALEALASELGGAPAVLREREASAHERASLVPGQRLLRGRERVAGGLDGWLDFLARGAGEAEPLLVVGEAHRRLLALRPFGRGNPGLAHACTAVLLELEGRTSGWTLPLAHRLLSRAPRQAEMLAGGEREHGIWLTFWLEQVRAVAAHAREALAAWESHRAAVASVVSGAVRGPLDDGVLEVLSRPGFTTANVVDGAGLTRHSARHALDALETASLVQPVGSGRSRHHVARALLDALLET